MWALKKGKKTRNTFSEETKNKLINDGWEVILDTLKKASGKGKLDTKGASANG